MQVAAVPRGVSEGTRTPDRLDHNQELYQLSYAHHVPPCGVPRRLAMATLSHARRPAEAPFGV